MQSPHLSWKDRFRFLADRDGDGLGHVVSQQKYRIVLEMYARELLRLYRKAQDELLLHDSMELFYDFGPEDMHDVDGIVFHQRNKIVFEAYMKELGSLIRTVQDQLATSFQPSLLHEVSVSDTRDRFRRSNLINLLINYGPVNPLLAYKEEGNSGQLRGHLWRRMNPGSSDSDAQDSSTSRMMEKAASHEATAGGGSTTRASTNKSNMKEKTPGRGFVRNKFNFHDNPLFNTNLQAPDEAFEAPIRPPVDPNQPGPSNLHDVGGAQSTHSSKHLEGTSQSSSASSEPASPRRSSLFDSQIFSPEERPHSSQSPEPTGNGQKVARPKSLKPQDPGVLNLLQPQESSVLGLLKSDQTMLSLSHWRSDAAKNEAALLQQTKSTASSKPQNRTPSSDDTGSVKGFGRNILAKLCCPAKTKKAKPRTGGIQG